MIADEEVDVLLGAFPHADPAAQDEMRPKIQEWLDQAEQQRQGEAVKRQQQVRGLFSDIDTLGGRWTKELQRTIGPFQTDPKQDRARLANIAYLSHVTGKSAEEISPIYPVIRDNYAKDNFNGEKLDDLGFYNRQKGVFESNDARNALTQQRDGDATTAAFIAASDGAAPDYSAALNAWTEKSRGQKGYDDADTMEHFSEYRDKFQKAYELGSENRDLFASIRGLLTQSTKAINAGAQIPEEAASRLIEATPEVRRAAMESIVAFAAHNSPDPQAGVSKLSQFFKNSATSYMRGVDTVRLGSMTKMIEETATQAHLDEIKSGRNIYMVGDVLKDESLSRILHEGEAKELNKSSLLGLLPGVDLPKATPEQREQLKAKLEKKMSLFRLSRELDGVAKEYLDPVKRVTSGNWQYAERGAYGLAGSIPQMQAAAIPVIGTHWMTTSMVGQAYDDLRAKFPDLHPEAAARMAGVTGIVQGALEHYQLQSTLGRMPFTKKLVESLTSPTSSVWRSLLVKGSAGMLEQNAQEGLQDLTPMVVQAVASSLSKDISGVDFHKEFGDWKGSRLETFFAVLPLTLLGVGASSIHESRAVQQALQSPQAMMEYGISKEAAESIAAAPKAQQEVLFQQARAARTTETMARGRKMADERIAASQAIAESPQTPTIQPFGDKWQMIEPDGAASATFDTIEQATIAYNDRTDIRHAGVLDDLRAVVAAFPENNPNRTTKINARAGTAADAFNTSPESVAEQMRIAGYAAGASPAAVRVFGSNTHEFREGIFTDVSRLYLGATPATFIEEKAHGAFEQELAAGTITLPQAEDAARQFLGEESPAAFSPEHLRETVVKMAEAYFFGNLSKAKWLPGAIKGFFDRMAVYFKHVIGKAAHLKQLKKEGKLDADWEAFLARAVGLDENVTHNRAAEAVAGELAGIDLQNEVALPFLRSGNESFAISAEPPRIKTTDFLNSVKGKMADRIPPRPDGRTSHSMAPANYAEHIAARFDALMRIPTARLTIYENAKMRIRDMVARSRGAIAAMQGEGHSTANKATTGKIEVLKEAHSAEMRDLVSQNAPHATRAALDRKLAADIAKVTGGTLTHARMLQSLAEYNALLSAFPAAVRGKVGGFVQLAQIKTDKGRGTFMLERIERLDRELEKLLKKEYRAKLDAAFDRFRPKREAGKKPKGKIGPDAQQILDAVEAAMAMDEAGVEGEIKRYDTLANDPRAKPQDVINYELIREMLPLLGDIKNADSSRLMAAISAVESVGSEGWAKWKFQQLEIQQNRKIAREQLTQDAGKTGVRDERVAADKAALKSTGWAIKHLLSLSSFAEQMDYAFGSKSATSRAFTDREREASNQREDLNQDLADKINDFFTRLAGGEVKGQQLRYDMALRTIDSKAGKFSQLEAITAVLMWDQEDGRRHMTGHLDEDAHPVGSWNYDQAFVDGLYGQLSPEGLEALVFLRAEYSAEHAWLNPLYKARHGIDLPKNDNYSPLSLTPVLAKNGEMVDPISGNVISGSILTPGSLRTRALTAVAEPNFRDALSVLVAHKKQLHHWAAYYDVAIDMQSALNHRDVTNAVHAKAGEAAVTALRARLDYFAQGGVRDAALQLATTKWLAGAVGRGSQAALFGRASVLMVQSTQLAAASVKMPVHSYVFRLSKLLSGNLGWGDAIKSPFIQRRIRQAPAIVQQAMQQLGEASKPNMIKHAARYAGQLISGADALFTAGTYAMLLDYHRTMAAEMGLTGGTAAEAYAHKEAERDTEAVAQPTRAANRSMAELIATHPMSRLGWSFASEGRQKIALFAWAVQSLSPTRIAKAGFLTFIVGGLATQVMKNLWREMKGDDDEKKWSAKSLLLSTAAGPLNGLPGFNMLVNDRGSLLSGPTKVPHAIDDLFNNDQDAAEIIQDLDTIVSAMGLFSDNAAALSSMTHVATDAAKLLKNVSE